MRIVIISDWFAEKMGYADHCLAKAMASLGHEIHVVTSNVQPYFNSPIYREIYEPFLGPGVVTCGVKKVEGYTLHRLPYEILRGSLRIKGLLRELYSIHPQILQTFSICSLTTCEAALGKLLLGYKLYTGNHVCASVFPFTSQEDNVSLIKRLKWFVFVPVRGRLVSLFSEKCFPATIDCAEIAVHFFGVPRGKLLVFPLGVDTDLFKPVSGKRLCETHLQFRRKFGFSESDIVCIYTGRFTEDKNPLCLAKAVEKLVIKEKIFRGLFIGDGPQKEAICNCRGCVVHPFVSYKVLPSLYHAADVGVWPRQESTSMLDAAACGIPIIISDRVQAVERVQGNGLIYRENDLEDLMRAIQDLRDVDTRKRLGSFGAAKILREYSWLSIARRRLEDYEAALR